MVEGLRPHFDLRVYCAGGAIDGLDVRPIPESRLARWIAKMPWVRRFRDVQTSISERGFDREVSARLEPADIFQGATGQCLRSLRKARVLGCRTALDVVNLHIDDFYIQMASSCHQFGIRPSLPASQPALVKEEYGESSLIRVMSTLARETFLQRGFSEDRVVVATPPIEVRDTQPDSGSVFRVAFVGLLEPWKGFHHLVDAFEQARIPASELVLWGGSGSRPVAQYLNSARRRCPGIQVRPDSVRQLGFDAVYGKCSVLVHPSLSDGYAYVVAEAMACGVPVIVSDRTGARDLVRHGENGYVIPAGDVEALSGHLKFLAAHPEKARAMGQSARETTAKLTREAFLRDYLKALEGLLNS